MATSNDGIPAQPRKSPDYLGATNEELFRTLGTSERGLSRQEAVKRLGEYGRNEIPAKDRRDAPSIFISQLVSPLVLILIAASVMAGFLGDPIDAIIIIAIVLINAILGFYQEFKSEKALAELKKYISFNAKVLRDGEERDIDVRELVPGDMVFLEIGDVVPADIRLTEAHDLAANESLVTGESFPVSKTADALTFDSTPPSQQVNMAFMGTVISNGTGKGIVIATGSKTEFGKTANILSAKEPPTAFQTSINKFGRFLIKIIFFLTIFVFASNALLGKGLLESLLFAMALAVGITPELLPIIITISLSSGAMHLVKKKVVVKRLVAIEDLGNIDVLCTDKTGTLTENRITLDDYANASGEKSGTVLEYALLCNSAILEKGKAEGNVIDTAVWEHRDAKGADISKYRKVNEVGFDYVRRRMGVVVETRGKRLYICKGAPESIMSICESVEAHGSKVPAESRAKELEQKFEELSARGFRVVAIASREIEKKEKYTEADEKGMTFDGFLSFLDPPKATAIQALKSFKKLGVELKLLTGDNELVAREVCREVGLEIKGCIVMGPELEKADDIQFAEAVSINNVFARVTPEQKFRIVSSLTKQGHVVGFLGDGVNDAPALKAADVGITVDSAVDVAKDSADIILLQKGLLVIAEGIRSGRKTFGNIMKYILNTISANFGNMFTLTISSLWLPIIPLLPSQILLNNLISDAPLTTISTDNVDEDYLHKPKRWNIKAISRFMVFFGLISTVFDLVTIGIMWVLTAGNAALFRTAWFLESVLSEIIITFAIRTRRAFWKSRPSRLLLYSSVLGIILSVGIVYPPFGFLFQFEALSTALLAIIAWILLAYFVLAEVAKRIFYRKYEI